MGTRYGRKASDGTTEYYDSKKQLEAAADAESEIKIRGVFALAGLIIGGLLAHDLITTFISEWPKFIRFILIIVGSVSAAALLWFSAVWILAIAGICFVISIVGGIGALLWKMI